MENSMQLAHTQASLVKKPLHLVPSTLHRRYMFYRLTTCGKKRKICPDVRQRTRRPTLKVLRRARADAGLTISELARRADVSRDTISNAERGLHSLQASTLHKVAQALGKTPSELLAEEERLAPKAESRSSLEPSLNDALEDLRSTTDRFQGYHAIQKALDEYREQWEKRLAEGDFDKAALEEAGRALKAFWPAVTAAADAEMGEGARWGVQPEEAAAQSVLVPAIQRFQVLCDRVNSTYSEKYAPAATVYAFPQRKAS
jgi:transcriptional regulator with XRE-family HTH domain